jgi:transcriptional regulator with XRE-family HTH domain
MDHPGRLIKTYRERCGMTQAELAAQWHGPGCGVSVRYVQEVEAGQRRLRDPQVLRRLSALLGIPLWLFGLDEYDPETGVLSGPHLLALLEQLIRHAWQVRRAAPLPVIEQAVALPRMLVERYRVLSEPRFLRLAAQVERLEAVLAVEQKRYPQALAHFQRMYATAQQLGEPDTLAIALMGIGIELERANRLPEAVEALEAANRLATRASRAVERLVSAYLARVYASVHDERHFGHAIERALCLAGSAYGAEQGEDFVFQPLSGVLAEQSYGLLDLQQPRQALALQPHLLQQIAAERNSWLRAWIPLDWARAWLLLGEVEASVQELRDFLQHSLALGSPHMISRAFRHKRLLERYETASVRLLSEELDELARSLPAESVVEDAYGLAREDLQQDR